MWIAGGWWERHNSIHSMGKTNLWILYNQRLWELLTQWLPSSVSRSIGHPKEHFLGTKYKWALLYLFTVLDLHINFHRRQGFTDKNILENPWSGLMTWFYEKKIGYWDLERKGELPTVTQQVGTNSSSQWVDLRSCVWIPSPVFCPLFFLGPSRSKGGSPGCAHWEHSEWGTLLAYQRVVAYWRSCAEQNQCPRAPAGHWSFIYSSFPIWFTCPDFIMSWQELWTIK